MSITQFERTIADFKVFNTEQEKRILDLTKKQMDFMLNLNTNLNKNISTISSDFTEFTDNCRAQMGLLSEGQTFLCDATKDFKDIKSDIQNLKQSC